MVTKFGGRSMGLLAVPAAVLVVTLGTAALADITPTPILTGPQSELNGVADTGYLAWAQNSRAKPNHYDAFVKPTGQPKQRANEAGTTALPESIELGVAPSATS